MLQRNIVKNPLVLKSFDMNKSFVLNLRVTETRNMHLKYFNHYLNLLLYLHYILNIEFLIINVTIKY